MRKSESDKSVFGFYSSGFFTVKRVRSSINGKKHSFFMVDKRSIAAILPVKGDGRIVLERQFRPPIGAYIYEIPAGHIDGKEKPSIAARRELEEETGYRAKRIKKLTVLYSSPGILNERIHLYLATGLGKGKRHLDPDESIALKVVSLDKALQMMKHGEIIDAKTVAAILYYKALLR
jgi:ADP-ribose pyrophosphatase